MKNPESPEKSVSKKFYARVTLYEQCKIRQYCLKHHISRNRMMIESAMYCIDNDIPVKELLNTG